MCQGCYSCRSFTNERCPLEPWQSRPVHIKVVAWPCIPDEVWINELWTSNSRITTHKSSSPARRNLQRTKMLEKKKKSTSTLPRFEHRDQERGAAGAAERIFQKPPIIWCVGEHNEVGRNIHTFINKITPEGKYKTFQDGRQVRGHCSWPLQPSKVTKSSSALKFPCKFSPPRRLVGSLSQKPFTRHHWYKFSPRTEEQAIHLCCTSWN